MGPNRRGNVKGENKAPPENAKSDEAREEVGLVALMCGPLLWEEEEGPVLGAARGGDKRPGLKVWIKCGGIREEERYRRVLITALPREEERAARSRVYPGRRRG